MALKERNLTIPQDVRAIHTEKGIEGGEDPKVDGFNLKKIFDEYLELHRIHPYGENRINVPEIRARGLDQNVGGLEGVVKGILGNRIKADSESASKIIAALALEGVKADGFKFHKDDPITDQLERYLQGELSFSDLSESTREAINRFYSDKFKGDPTLENILALKQAIMNLPAAKPGDVAYIKDSALGKVIAYIASQMDNPIPGHKKNTQRRVAYLQQQLAQLANHPRYGLELIRMFNEVLPEDMKLSTTANIGQAIEAFQKYTAARDALYKAAEPQTYTLPPAYKKAA